MTKSPHFWWLISILVLTIIALVAFIITERIIGSVELMGYISVCSIILSITLSIFAIQYTYTSNNEIHRQFEKINSVAESIRGTSENLSATNNLLNSNLEQILVRLDSIGQSQQLITTQIKDIQNSGINTSLNNFLSSSATKND